MRRRRARPAARSPLSRAVAALALVGTLTACGSTGDTGELLLDGAQACSTVCTSHPDVDAFSYRAGGGVPLLFLGTVEASCRCAAKARGADSPVSALEEGLP